MPDDQIITTVHPTGSLTPAQWDEIWILTQEFFVVERAYAEEELRRRQSIALFRMNGALLGMASLEVYPANFRGRDLAVISTTHVLLRENWRGRNLLQRLGLRTFLATRLRYPLRPIYWFFDTFSYKSYLLLPRNFVQFWPRHDQPTPEARAALIDLESGAIELPAFELRAAEALGVDPHDLARRLTDGVRPEPAMLDLVKRVHDAGARTALVSNSWRAADYGDLRDRFDAVVLSQSLGIRKPDPAIYEEALRRLDLRADRCVFVDDLGGNLKPARALGMITIRHETPQKTIPEIERLLLDPAS